MGFFSSSNKMNPFVMPGIEGLEGFADDLTLGKAGKFSGKMLKQMQKGNFSGLAGTILSPIHDRYATNMREAVRANQMGGNALMQGWQPGLMSAIEQNTRNKMAEGEGLAYGEAIPQLWGQATGAYQGALNSQRQAEIAAREAALRGRIAGTYQEPSIFSKIMGTAQGIGSLAGMI